MARIEDFVRLIARLFLAGVFLYDAVIILKGYGAAIRYTESFGITGMILPLVLLLQLGGGAALILGWQTRLIAPVFALFCLLTAIFFHRNLANANEAIQFGKDFGLAGGFLLLFVAGPGRYSIGWRLGGKRK